MLFHFYKFGTRTPLTTQQINFDKDSFNMTLRRQFKLFSPKKIFYYEMLSEINI